MAFDFVCNFTCYVFFKHNSAFESVCLGRKEDLSLSFGWYAISKVEPPESRILFALSNTRKINPFIPLHLALSMLSSSQRSNCDKDERTASFPFIPSPYGAGNLLCWKIPKAIQSAQRPGLGPDGRKRPFAVPSRVVCRFYCCLGS